MHPPRSRPLAALGVSALAVLALAGCTDEAREAALNDPDRVAVGPGAPGGHTHTTIVGDGTTASAGGYTMTDVSVPRRTGVPGDLSFRILDDAGEPVTGYEEEQTKLLHLYVVRDDYAVFRHLHPTQDDTGTWRVRAALDQPGRYRVVAEFLPTDQPDGSHVVVAQEAVVPGRWEAQPVAATSAADDGVVWISAPDTLPVGPDERMTLDVSDGAGGNPNLGTYLGAYAHLTGFDVETGAFVHAHPLGAPETTDDGSELTFHTEFDTPGDYVFFVQVRVDGFVHTVPVSSTVS